MRKWTMDYELLYGANHLEDFLQPGVTGCICMRSGMGLMLKFNVRLAVGSCHTGLGLRREPCKNETFWHDSDPWRIFSTSSRGLWDFPRALTYIYGIPTSFVVEPACATVTSPQSEV
jgi:hypothetical protein